jgi:arginyl-tRNA synthetase
MPTILSQLDQAFRQAIHRAFSVDADPLVAASGNSQLADYQSNAAMALAKQLSAAGTKTNPREVAQKIVEAIDLSSIAEPPTIAGPGFINIRLLPGYLATYLASAAPPRLGIDAPANPLTVVIDYSSPNVAKEMAVHHLRSTVIGDAVCNVLEFVGHTVVRQNHLGDWGTQFGMLIALLQEGTTDAAVKIADLEGFYRAAKEKFDADPAFADRARQRVVALQAGDPEARKLWLQICDETRKHYQPIYQRLGVGLKPEHERGESFYNPRLPTVVTDLQAAGIAVESEGAIVSFPDGQGEGKAPLMIRKSDGGYGYGTTDLAAVRFRVNELHADRVIVFTDARQQQHFAHVYKTAASAGWAKHASLEHAPFGSMLGADGKPFKTRSGGTVKLAELLDEAEERALAVVKEKNPDMPEADLKNIARMIGIGAVKYADLSKDRTSDYVFTWDKMLSFDGNTAPYLQYAHARICSIFRKAELSPASLSPSDLTPSDLTLTEPTELALAKHIARFAEVLDAVVRDSRPHLLCTWLYELAGRFSAFYEQCDVLKAHGNTRNSRLLLANTTRSHLATGLRLLGIEAPEQM